MLFSVRARSRSITENGKSTLVSTKTGALSVRKICVGCRIADGPSAFSATVALLSEREDVGEQDAAMATAGQSLRGDGPFSEQASHERTGESEEFAGLSGSDDRIGAGHS
jgi:hypothetical protein